MSVLTVPILPQPIGNRAIIWKFKLTRIKIQWQIRWASWLPQQCRCQALGLLVKKTSKFINTQDIKHICNFYKSPELPLSLISDTFFLLANRSIDPNLREIAASYIVHYDYKEVLH